LEIMRRNAGTQEAIAQNDPHLLPGVIQASQNEGIHSFDQHLMPLLQSGSVTMEKLVSPFLLNPVDFINAQAVSKIGTARHASADGNYALRI
jgi:hypothetical protein